MGEFDANRTEAPPPADAPVDRAGEEACPGTDGDLSFDGEGAGQPAEAGAEAPDAETSGTAEGEEASGAAGQPGPAGEPAADGQPGHAGEPAADGQAGDGQAGDDVPEPSPMPTRRGARELAKIAKERDDYLDQLKRVKADFENYRKRILRQQTEHLERAAESLIEKLLPVLDNFDAALAHGTGFEQVHASLVSILGGEGLIRIDPEGEPFDPTEADAVAHEDGDGGPVVAQVLRPGYRWKGRVLRPAMVRVKG